jgi:LPXTG-motif cell wall-anchored protein
LPAAGASAMQLSMLALLLLGVAGMIGLARRRLVVR